MRGSGLCCAYDATDLFIKPASCLSTVCVLRILYYTIPATSIGSGSFRTVGIQLWLVGWKFVRKLCPVTQSAASRRISVPLARFVRLSSSAKHGLSAGQPLTEPIARQCWHMDIFSTLLSYLNIPMLVEKGFRVKGLRKTNVFRATSVCGFFSEAIRLWLLSSRPLRYASFTILISFMYLSRSVWRTANARSKWCNAWIVFAKTRSHRYHIVSWVKSTLIVGWTSACNSWT